MRQEMLNALLLIVLVLFYLYLSHRECIPDQQALEAENMFFRKKKSVLLAAPVSGTSVHLNEVPDPAFAQGLIGEGIAIMPSAGLLVSPCDGTIAYLIDTHHSVIVTHRSGVEVLMHIGVNTVQLRGTHFKPLVQIGDAVSQGQPLIEFDKAAIEEAGYTTITPVVMANADVVGELSATIGGVTAGATTVLEVRVK